MWTNNYQITIDISEWVERIRHDPQHYLERQATEVLLAAIGQSKTYSHRLYLKGGVLMGLVYQSPRQTVDLDFTANFEPTDDIEDGLRDKLDPELQRASARLGYPDLVCSIQRIERRPRQDRFTGADFPALDIKFAYAKRGTNPHRQLEQGRCPNVIEMEISFREPVHAVQFVYLGPNGSMVVRAYSLVDVIAEKLRALLQQSLRNRNRRQDIYDIDFLIRRLSLTSAEKHDILTALRTKAYARNIEPRPESLADDEIKRRAELEWYTLELEIGDLPPFEDAYAYVEAFYRSLPW